MRVNVNAFIAVILCTVLLGGLWLLKYRTISEDNIWNPDELYGTVGGSSYFTSHVSSERSASSGTALTLPSLRTISHKASTVPYHLMASSPNNLITSSPYSPITSSPISYASSDAQFHSFGGGGAMSDAVGGSLRANPEAMPSATSVSMPSMPNYAMVARSQNTEMMQGEMAAVSAISFMENACYMPLRSSFISQSANLYQIGASEVANSTRYSVTGRHNTPVMGGGWEAWLNGLGADDGFLYVDGEGNRYYDMDLLQKAFEDAQKNSQFPGMTWEQFLEKFFDPSGRHNVPVGEPWISLLFAALLVVIQRRRLAKQ